MRKTELLIPAGSLDVLKTAGLAVAMGNANANVKKIADVEVMDNDHDGVAEAITSPQRT